jgi:WD40 repeat protein
LPPAYSGQRRRILRRAGIDRDLIAIIEKAVDPDPARRYPDAGALAADLKAFKAGVRIGARRYSLWALLTHWTRRHRAAAITIACVTAASVAGVWFYVRSVSAERDRTELARTAAQDAKEAAAAALAEKRLADARAAEAALEQGRAALLHNEPEAQARLTEAYKREPSPSTAFMLARAMQTRLQEEARFASTFGRMWSATFSPDGTQIVTTDDRTAQIWNSQTHQLLATLPHDCEVYHAVYSSDGRILVTVGQFTVRIWDPGRGVLLRELQALPVDGPRDYYRAAISPNGRFVAVIDSVGSVVQVWRAATGALVAELRNHPSGFPGLEFGADSWLATTGGDEVRVFDVRTWTQVLRLPGAVHGLAFDPRSRLVTGTTAGDVVLWHVPSGARLRQLRTSGESVDTVAFSSNGEFVAAGSRDGVIQVWHAASGVQRSQFNPRHSKILALEFDPSAAQLLVAHSDGTVVVADAAQGLPVALLDGPRNVVRSAHFDPSARRVVSASWDGTARLWNVGSPYRRWTSDPVSDECGAIDMSKAAGRYVAVGCAGRGVRVWDTMRDRLLAELPSVSFVVSGGFLGAFPVVSAEADRAAIARAGAAEVYELPSGRLLRTVAHGARISALAFAPTGGDVISGAVDGSLLISHDDGTVRALPTAASVDAVALLPDGRAIVSDTQRRLRVYGASGIKLADMEMPVRVMSLRGDATRMVALPNFYSAAAPPLLLDLETFRVIAELAGHVGQVFSARWVRGKRILTAGADGTARLWDGATGRLLNMYRGGTRFLSDATLMNDSIVIGGDADGLLRFWDASSGARLWTMQAHKSAVVSVYAEDGDLITRGFTGEITRWRLPPAEQVIEACRRHPHCAE